MAFNYFRFFTCFVFLLHPQIISPVSVYIYWAADTDLKHPSLLPPLAQERPAVLKATSALRLWFTGSTVPSSLASCPFSTFFGPGRFQLLKLDNHLCALSVRMYLLWGRNIHQIRCIFSYSRLSPTLTNEKYTLLLLRVYTSSTHSSMGPTAGGWVRGNIHP